MKSRKRTNRQTREDNKAWRSNGKGRKHPTNPGSILPARCDKSKKIKSDNDKEEAFKSFFLVNMDAIELTQPQTTAEIAANLSRHIKEQSFRPLVTIEFDDANSPLSGKTPGGTKLYKDAKYNAIYAFSNRESAKQQYETSSQCQQMSAFITSIKSQTIDINAAHQKSILRERSKANFKRSKTQKSVMGESAKEHMEKITTTIHNVKFEWAHLLAHAIVGAIGQNKNNLVATTTHANTDMIFAEADIPLLNKHYPDGFTLEVSAELMVDTNAALRIEYKIITPDFQKTYVFDGQSKQAPHLAFRQYFHGLTKALIPNSEPSPYHGNARTPVINENNFFSKRGREASKENSNKESLHEPSKKKLF